MARFCKVAWDLIRRLKRSRRETAGLFALFVFLCYWAFADVMVYGLTQAARTPLVTTPAAFGLEYEAVEFPSREDGVPLRGWLLGDPGAGPAVLIVHGLASNRSARPGIEVARFLRDAGAAVLLFDLRAHGESGGDLVSGGFYERRDLLGAYDFVIARGGAPGRVGAIGFSMGGAVALIGAAEEPGIAAVVADGAFADVEDLIANETALMTPFPRWVVPLFMPAMKLVAQIRHGIDLGHVVPEESVAELGYPVLVIHGGADDRIPGEHGRRLHAAAPAGSDLWSVPDVHHAGVYESNPGAYADRVVGYFRARLWGTD